ncbi:hypothetical protein BC941DRAFT_217589 [Chlamydoabsidia padenii]|nr:hypothetical protein BC941DRAFT_217589 [Chlamydoabsidia padenii]
MKNHGHKLQDWQQELKQQACEYDEYAKKLESENQGNMEARRDQLLEHKKTIEQEMSMIFNNFKKKSSFDCTDEVTTKDAANLAYYRMLGLQILSTDGITHEFELKSVSSSTSKFLLLYTSFPISYDLV